jgi:outer membrane beta-barrel protein
MKQQVRRAPRAFARVALALGALLPTLAHAQLAELENPGSVSAIQERQYRMNHELALQVGVLPLDAFYKGLVGEVGYTYHFSDHFAWRVGRGGYSYNLDTGLRQQLERDFDVNPTQFEVAQWYAGSDLILSPLYGKSALFNRKVIHFTAYALAGGTVFKMNVGFRPAVHLGAGVRFFSSQRLSFRLEVTNNVVIADRPFNVPTVQLGTALNFGASE